jgi:anti-sigma factor (TIGR02949 family)
MARVGGLTCKEAIDIMAEFLEAALGRTAADDLARHLEACDECTAYLNTYQKTRALAGATVRAEMPAEVRARLRAFLLARLSAKSAG